MRIVPRPGDAQPFETEAPLEPRLADDDLDAARELADVHREIAAGLPPHSRIRGLVLRCAGHWSRLGGIPRNGLTRVADSEGD